MKFQRDYKLTIQGNKSIAPFVTSYEYKDTTVIEYPMTLDLDIKRDTLSSANTARFTIWNLGPDTRAALFHDRYDTLNYRQIILNAGYTTDQTLPIVFQGNILQAYSRRQGADWLTEIEAFDGGFGMRNGDVAVSKPAGWNFKDLISTLMGKMPQTAEGAISPSIEVPNMRGITVVGNAWEGIRNLVGTGIPFIDNEAVNVLAENEYLLVGGAIPVIDSDTGILGSPRRQQAIIEVDTLFEPRAVIGQLVNLQSQVEQFNGDYQIRGLHHRGRISGAFDQGVRTTHSLWAGASAFRSVTA